MTALARYLHPWPTTTQSPPPTRTQIAAMVTASQARALVQSRRGK